MLCFWTAELNKNKKNTNSKNQLTKINWFKKYLQIFSFKADFLFYVLKKEQASSSVGEILKERIKEIGLYQQFEKEKSEEESENSINNDIEIREKEEKKEKLFEMEIGNEEESEDGVGMHLGQQESKNDENIKENIEMEENLNKQITPKKLWLKKNQLHTLLMILKKVFQEKIYQISV